MRKIGHLLLLMIILSGSALPVAAGDTHGGGPNTGSMGSFSGVLSDDDAPATVGGAPARGSRMGGFTSGAEEMGMRAQARSPKPLRTVSLMARMKLYAILSYTLIDDFIFFRF